MNLSPVERQWADDVRDQFGRVLSQLGAAYHERPIRWDGEAIHCSFASNCLELTNSLMDETWYSTVITLLDGRGIRLAVTDEEFDERFTYFDIKYLARDWDTIPSEITRERFDSGAELKIAVVARARFLKDHIAELHRNRRDVLPAVADRVRTHELSRLIPQWERFVAEVAEGYDGRASAYRAGVNVRGAIKSLLKWEGRVVPRELRDRIAIADAAFDEKTLPAPLDLPVVPHPRARRWWRLPATSRS